jgi:TonB family protein
VELPPPPGRKAKISVGQPLPPAQVITAQPIPPLAKPIYPAVALAARADAAFVGVRITVDAEGRVSDVRQSLASLTMPSPFAAEFRAAVEAAVTQWRFRPAELVHLELVKDSGGDFMRVTGREKIDWSFDVEFAFNRTGDVLTHLPK